MGNLLGSHRSTIITVYNGAFDSSSAIFLFIKVRNSHFILSFVKDYKMQLINLLLLLPLLFLLQLIYESGVSLRSSFLFLSACSIVHLLRTLFLMPRKFIPYPLPDNYTYGYWSTTKIHTETFWSFCHTLIVNKDFLTTTCSTTSSKKKKNPIYIWLNLHFAFKNKIINSNIKYFYFPQILKKFSHKIRKGHFFFAESSVCFRIIAMLWKCPCLTEINIKHAHKQNEFMSL